MTAKPLTPPLVVFSDLDGTLLDHDSYSWQAAVPALTRLAEVGAPVVLASSKTAAEITVLQREMGLSDYPAIVENGAGILGEETPPKYECLRVALDQTPADLRQQFRGFGDMSVAEIIDVTGLSSEQAARAEQRMFSEPGLWSGSETERQRFQAALGELGVTARYGGRFLTLSFGGTKADRMEEIIARYRPRHTVALGDAPNDVEMLEKADFGVIIANKYSKSLPVLKNEAEGRVLRTIEAGPSGWNRAMMELLDRLNLRR
ncbi:HAD-IIB family hydrolase [Phaeobacter sp. QD34_3]|uniref:HAD-IIB family hydrolase n=1 Tax=unclassified Phaeobacter TaxID=2621772 RepID=UPI00237F0746|nr:MULTISPECIES: HAD-IIB family hydrolase [unclassified Phaeobacter]MDE4132150.1 HAD-IIB family hydrolase [Phaeobacter sp. QD34_3]MDE4135788.1 HAD-IIB family hydrolase [Phaeobacter sp. QD34_24]